jgi:hypothetical protein
MLQVTSGPHRYCIFYSPLFLTIHILPNCPVMPFPPPLPHKVPPTPVLPYSLSLSLQTGALHPTCNALLQDEGRRHTFTFPEGWLPEFKSLDCVLLNYFFLLGLNSVEFFSSLWSNIRLSEIECAC